MSPSDIVALSVMAAALLIVLPVAKLLALRFGASAEVARKSVHICMGLACLGFPWIFQDPLPVWILAITANVLLIILRCAPNLRAGIGSSLHGVKRLSYGEILFPPAIATVFHLSLGEPVYYVIPIAVLTIADAAGALTGDRWGRFRYICGEDTKTVEGSLAFLLCAFLCIFVPLQWLTELPAFHLVAISLILAVLTMMVEGISDRGFDNLVLPVGAYFMLVSLLPLDTGSLVTRLIALCVLFALLLWGSRWSTLQGSSLLGGALLAYGCAILGDWRHALPLLALFISHVYTSHRHHLKRSLSHPLRAVIGISIACLPWMIASTLDPNFTETSLAGISFAMANQLAILNMSTGVHLNKGECSVHRSILKGWLIAGTPGLIWIVPQNLSLLAPAALSMLAGALSVKLIQQIQSSKPKQQHWRIKGGLALFSSSPVLLFLS